MVRMRTGVGASVAVAGALLLTGCGAGSAPSPSATISPTPSPTASAVPSSAPTATPSVAPVEDLGPLVPSGDPVPIASDLPAPWSIAVLADGALLVSERDTGVIVEIVNGAAVPLTTVPGVAAAGEGGLLGLAALEEASGSYLYA